MQSTEQVPSRTDAPQVTPSSSSSSVLPRRTPGATGHTPQWDADDDKPVIPTLPGQRKPAGLAPRPAPPRQQLTARMAPQLRDLDWDPRSHIEQAGWPTVPAYSDAWGRPSAWAAFGDAA